MKKIVVLLLVLVMVVAALMGCTQNAATTSAAASQQASTQPATSVEVSTQPATSEAAAGVGQYTEASPMKVAFVYHGTVGDKGWFYGHDQARIKVEADLNWVETQTIESAKPGSDAERVFTELCDEGYKVIVAASLDYEEDCISVGEQYPDVAFLVCSGSKTTANVEPFFPRRDQLWYLLGQVAGGLSKTGKLGLVGSLPNQPTINPIADAWILGAQSVNPNATLNIIWLNTFDNPPAERDAALSMIEEGCDVIMQGTNNPAHVQVCEEKGVYSMSQWEDMSQYGPNTYVAGEQLKWEVYYEDTFTKIAQGTWKASLYYPPYSMGVAQETKFYQTLPAEVMQKYTDTKAKLLADPQLMWAGPIYDIDGNLVVKDGERVADADVYKTSWLVKGIISSVK
jgi:basic membrane protein A and related proteins